MNKANTYTFPMRARQLRLFSKNIFFVTHSRKKLTTKTTTPKNVTQEWGGGGKTTRERPGDHPEEIRTRWEERRKANHPEEIRTRWEERAAMWKFMRGWRPRRSAERARLAMASTIGVHYDSAEHQAAAQAEALRRAGASEHEA
ncbi:MAG TPA: hypothetical protein VFI23_02075, partial [Rhizomicrobium sp.]|nr:hypothetical protein [Rhizomicrobium sp.]